MAPTQIYEYWEPSICDGGFLFRKSSIGMSSSKISHFLSSLLGSEAAIDDSQKSASKITSRCLMRTTTKMNVHQKPDS